MTDLSCAIVLPLVLFNTPSAEKLPSFLQRYVDVRTDVILIHERVESGTLQLTVHLGRHARENHMNAVLVIHLNEVLQVVNACRIYERDLAHTYNSDARTMTSDVGHQLVKFIGNVIFVRFIHSLNAPGLMFVTLDGII